MFAFALPPYLMADIQKAYSVPALLASPDGKTGEICVLRMAISRKSGDNSPLAVAIVEDSPSGAGESLRSSIWQACMVAALSRADDMRGVKVEVTVPGTTDGPSCGAAIALAILSGLDGRDLPADFAMTGTIMPDGTIGRVGAVPAKMRAAAAGKMKRILVPAYLRFETDAESAKDVDLKELAGSLGMEFLPVENLEQAYRDIHRLPPAAAVPLPRGVLDLPATTEAAIKKEYTRAMAAADDVAAGIPKEEREKLLQDAFLATILAGNQNQARRALRSGKLVAAVTYVQYCEDAWRAAAKAWEVIKAIDLKQTPDVAGELDTKAKALIAATSTPWNILVAAARKVPETGNQFLAEFHEWAGIEGVTYYLEARLASFSEQTQGSNAKEEDKRAAIAEARLGLKFNELILAYWSREATDAFAARAELLLRGLPQMATAADPSPTERFFYGAWRAAHNDFETQTVKAVAAELKITRDDALARMVLNDIYLAIYLAEAQAVEDAHRAVAKEPDPALTRKLRVTLAQTYALSLAKVAGLAVRWSELDVQFTDAGLKYGRSELLTYLLTTAREHAVANIAECRRLGIPCIQPIFYVEDADLCRDDGDTDKVEVLTNYWRASLQAQAMVMLYGRK